MKFFLVDFLRSWLLSGLSLVARCGFILALVTGFTALPISAAEPTHSVLHFDGNDSYLELPPHSLDGYKAITVEAWVRPERLGLFTRFFEFGTQKDRLVANWQHGGGGYVVRAMSEEGQVMGWQNGFLSRYESNGWIHLTVVSDGNRIQSYLNGELILQDATKKSFRPAGNGKEYYFGKATFGGGIEDFCGQMDEIRIWDKVLSADEIKEGLARRLPWGTTHLVALLNSDTNRLKSIDGGETSFIFRGALSKRIQERSLTEVSRTLRHRSIELFLPPNTSSVTNIGLAYLKLDGGVAFGHEMGSNQFTIKTDGRPSSIIDLHWFPQQFATELFISGMTPSNGPVSVVLPLHLSSSNTSVPRVYLTRMDTNAFVDLLKVPLTQSIRELREVQSSLNALKRLGLNEERVEALIDAAVAGGFRSYAARTLVQLEVPTRLAKYYQVRQSYSARFLGGIVAALGFVMGCLWVFNQRMAFAPWFAFTCVPVSVWLLLGENSGLSHLRLAIICALVPLVFGLVRSTLGQKIPLRCWLPIAALLPGLGSGVHGVMSRVAEFGNFNYNFEIDGSLINLACLALVWLCVETSLSFRNVNSSISKLQSCLMFWIWMSTLRPRNFSSVKVSKAEFEGGGWLVV